MNRLPVLFTLIASLFSVPALADETAPPPRPKLTPTILRLAQHGVPSAAAAADEIDRASGPTALPPMPRLRLASTPPLSPTVGRLATRAVPSAADLAGDVDGPSSTRPPPPPPWRLKDGAGLTMAYYGFAMPAWFFTGATVIHEGSHALLGKAVGADIAAFHPYPHFAYRADGQRLFVFGDVEFQGNLSKASVSAMLMAPYMTDLALFAATDLTLSYGLSPDSKAAVPLYVAGMVMPLVDFAMNVNMAAGPGNDFHQLSKTTGLPLWAIWATGDAIAAVGLWRVIHHGKRLFFTNEPAERRDTASISILPVASPQFSGLTAIGRF